MPPQALECAQKSAERALSWFRARHANWLKSRSIATAAVTTSISRWVPDRVVATGSSKSLACEELAQAFARLFAAPSSSCGKFQYVVGWDTEATHVEELVEELCEVGTPSATVHALDDGGNADQAELEGMRAPAHVSNRMMASKAKARKKTEEFYEEASIYARKSRADSSSDATTTSDDHVVQRAQQAAGRERIEAPRLRTPVTQPLRPLWFDSFAELTSAPQDDEGHAGIRSVFSDKDMFGQLDTGG